jgi:hypothetical protein
MIRCWKTEICRVRLLQLRNIHGMTLVKYSRPHSLPKFLYGFCHWRIMVGSICVCNKNCYRLFHEYKILPNPHHFFLPSQCPIFVSRKYGQPAFCQVTAYLNQHYGYAGPVLWLLRSVDLSLLHAFLMKSYERDGLKNHSIEKSGTLVLDYECCCLQDHPKMKTQVELSIESHG